MSDDALEGDDFNRLMDGVFRLERSIFRIGTVRLKRWNMTLSAYTAMRVLDGRPHLSLTQLSRSCYVQPQTMTRIVTSLQERGYVARSTSAHSERALSLQLTPEGVKALREMDTEVLKISNAFTTALRHDEIHHLTELLLSAARQVEHDLAELDSR